MNIRTQIRQQDFRCYGEGAPTSLSRTRHVKRRDEAV